MAPPRLFWFGEPPVIAFLRLRVAEAGRLTPRCSGLGVSRWRSFLLAAELDIVGPHYAQAHPHSCGRDVDLLRPPRPLVRSVNEPVQSRNASPTRCRSRRPLRQHGRFATHDSARCLVHAHRPSQCCVSSRLPYGSSWRRTWSLLFPATGPLGFLASSARCRRRSRSGAHPPTDAPRPPSARASKPSEYAFPLGTLAPCGAAQQRAAADSLRAPLSLISLGGSGRVESLVESLTALLEKALAEISKLPPPQQEEVALLAARRARG